MRFLFKGLIQLLQMDVDGMTSLLLHNFSLHKLKLCYQHDTQNYKFVFEHSISK